MTWEQYLIATAKLSNTFGEARYSKKNIEAGFKYWKLQDRPVLDELIGKAIMLGQPFDLTVEGMKKAPQVKQVQYYEHKPQPVSWDSLDKLKAKHDADSLWDLVLKWKKKENP